MAPRDEVEAGKDRHGSPGRIIPHHLDVEIGPGLTARLAGQALDPVDLTVVLGPIEVGVVRVAGLPEAVAVEQRAEDRDRVGVVGNPACKRNVEWSPRSPITASYEAAGKSLISTSIPRRFMLNGKISARTGSESTSRP